MRNKFPRSIEPFYPPNLDVCYWAPGYGGSTTVPGGNTGSFGIFNPNMLSADQQFALGNSTISTPFDISSYLDLPSTYSDLSARPMSIMGTPSSNADHWASYTVIVTGVDAVGNVETDTSTEFLVDNTTTLMSVPFQYITRIQLYNHTGIFPEVPTSNLLFDPGYFGSSRFFFPNPKNTSFTSNNSFAVSLDFPPSFIGSPDFNYDVNGGNTPFNVNANINPLTGAQVYGSFINKIHSYILPNWSGITLNKIDSIEIPVNFFGFQMLATSGGTTPVQTSDGIEGYLIFNQFGQWFR